MFTRLWSVRQGSPLPPCHRLQEPRTLWVNGSPFSPPVLGWGGRSSAARSVNTHCVLCAALVLPQPRGCLHFCGEPTGSSCMAPGPTQPPVQGPYSLLTAWAGTRALPSRPIWDNRGGSPWGPLVRPPSHSSTCLSPWFLGKPVPSAEWRKRPCQPGGTRPALG